MRVVLLHLSDFHFSPKEENPAMYRAREVISGVLGNIAGIDAIGLIATGDFVDRGQAGAFEYAKLFIESLKTNAYKHDPKVAWLGEILLPGNHDVVLPQGKEQRYIHDKALLDLKNKLAQIDPNSIPLAIVLHAQDQFFEFENSITGRISSAPIERLEWEVNWPLGKHSLRIIAVNTSFMSSNSDEQGDLLAWLPELASSPESTFTVVAMHHPFNWLHRDNMRGIERRLVPVADLVLSGHEHQGQNFVRHSQGSTETAFFEGDGFGEPGTRSGFSALLLDLGGMRKRTFTFQWSGERYTPGTPKDFLPLRRNLGSPRDGFQISETFQEHLDDPGLALINEHRRIRMEDVFVYPKLRDITLEIRSQKVATVVAPKSSESISKKAEERYKKSAQAPEAQKSEMELDPVINGINIVNQLATSPRVIVSGEKRVGKSALVLKYFAELRNLGLVPVLLTSKDLKKRDVDSLLEVVSKRADEQYGSGAGEKFRALPLSKRVILIDDLHEFQGSSTELAEIMKSIEGLALHTLATSDELFLLRHVFAATQEHEILKYRIYRVLHLDPRQQKEMATRVQRTMTMAQDHDEDGAQLARLEQNLEAVIGDGRVMALPGEVKGIIRDLIKGSSAGAEYGAFGFFYDRMIRNDIDEALEGYTREEAQPQTDVIYAFLTEIAYSMHEAKDWEMSIGEFDEFVQTFSETHVHVTKPELLKVLADARLMKRGDNTLQFREKYQRYFFLATKLKDLISDDETRDAAKQTLEGMADALYEQDNAEVVLFTIYLTKNKWLLQKVRERARLTLSGRPECDMDTAFKEQLSSPGAYPKKIFPEGATDALDGSLPVRASGSFDQRLEETIRNLNEAFNTINIIGQTVRNYPAKIERSLRKELVQESCSLALRALSEFISLIRDGREELEILARRHLRVSGKDLASTQGVDSVNLIAAKLVSLCGFGVVRRATTAVASPHLMDILLEIGSEDSMVSMKMIRTSILLDIRRMSPKEVEMLFKSLQDNPIAQEILANIVGNHLRAFRATRTRREQLSAAVHIDPQNPSLFYSPEKPRSIGFR